MTLLPVLYSIFVLDLKLMRWESEAPVKSEASRCPVMWRSNLSARR